MTSDEHTRRPHTLLIKVKSSYSRGLKRLIQHSIYFLILLIVIPLFLFFELGYVLPTVAERWTVEYVCHLVCIGFLLQNIISNMVFGMFTNTSITGIKTELLNTKDWTLCSYCDVLVPPRAWHCDICNVCILKRDHHCTYFASCVGYFNLRYFIYFVFYLFIAMMYAFYYNLDFVLKAVTWTPYTIFKFIFPLATLALGFEAETIFVLILVVNGVVGALCGFLFFYHFINLLNGRTTPEKKKSLVTLKVPSCWDSIMEEAFGRRWHLTWISAFINSPLTGNGCEWEQNKLK